MITFQIFDEAEERHRNYSQMMLTTKNFDDNDGGKGISVRILMKKNKTTRRERRMPTTTTTWAVTGTVRARTNIMTEENDDDNDNRYH
jgi:hypothetical protein